MYTVFYQAGLGSFFMSKTDFSNESEAEGFIESDLFRKHGFSFEFMLKDGSILIKGKPQRNTMEYFKSSMKFAIDIPKSEFGYQQHN